MKKRLLSTLLALCMVLAFLPVIAIPALAADYGPWSDWSTEQPVRMDGRQIETRSTVIGYNMVTYLTMTQNGVRQYRNYSVNGNYSAYGLRTAYGEFHYTYYADASSIANADTCAEGTYVNYAGNTAGYNMGRGTAYCGWGVRDCLIWFIESENTVTEYRYRDQLIKTYEVVFRDWDGAVLSTQIIAEGGDAVPPPSPSRTGYTFTGWSAAYTNIRSNITIMAQYRENEPESLIVLFDANGGTVSPTSKTVTNGETYGELPTPTRSSYSFDGWFTSASGGTQITSSTTVNLTANQTLYAHWTISNSYTVTFDANGGTGTPSPQAKEENVPLTLSSLIPSKTFVLQYNANGGSVSPASKNVSCTFNHWNTEQNGGGTAYTSGSSYTLNADVTLYAQWTNPAAGVLATPTRSGYDFAGWFTSANGGVQITESSTVTENLTVYAHWMEQTDPYNLGDETYSFKNYGDSDSFGGHCFGMSITSAGYHNNLLDIRRIGGNANTPLYSFGKTQTVTQPICYYQSIQGTYSARAIVAGGSSYLNGASNIASDWQEVVNYVSNHAYDSTGILQIGFRKNGEGGHAINFLRYENVNGQDRIYAYDNNFPNQETYFYQDSSGRVWQVPVQTFSGAIDCIALRDCRIYFNSVGDFDATHVLYMAKDAATVEGYTYSYMDGTFSDEEYVMYEIPANVDRVIIIPNRDNADFIYMDTEYSFGEITDETRGELRFASLNEGAVSTNASFQIFEDDSVVPTVTLNKTALTLTEGGNETLTATVTPDNAVNKNVTWTSSDPLVATVANGKVTAVKPGTATITVTMNGGGNKATCTVTVLGGVSLFTDVTENDWFYDGVAWAAENGITSGTSATTFSPNDPCTRAQFVTFLWRAAGEPEPISAVNPFRDVTEAAYPYYYKAILWANERGIAKGTGDGTTFSPETVVTRAQAVTFMYRFAQQNGIATKTGTANFDDVKNEGSMVYYYDAIGWAVANGITSGTGGNNFSPMAECDRAMMVTFLYRLLKDVTM